MPRRKTDSPPRRTTDASIGPGRRTATPAGLSIADSARARITPAAIWRIVQIIPESHVASYGQIADLAGFPRHARFVARALNLAPETLALPWHRVLGVGGRIAFSDGSEPFKEQVALLVAEGILVRNGRVDWKRFQWQPALDELLWAPPLDTEL